MLTNGLIKNARKDLRKIANKKHCQPDIPAICIRNNEILNKSIIRYKKHNYSHMKLDDIENAINQMWNNFNTKQPQALPIQNSDIWRAHLIIR